MSQQRRMRAELKQGVHQFTMSLYQSYRQSLSHEEAVNEIITVLEEEHGYFSKNDLSQKTQTSALPLNIQDYVDHVEKMAKKEEVLENQYTFYNDLEILMSAQEILSKYTPTRE